MRTKLYKMRSLTGENGIPSPLNMDLEFEGKRAYVILDSVSLGTFQLKARLEIDPALLQEHDHQTCDFLYRGTLVLPRPQDN